MLEDMPTRCAIHVEVFEEIGVTLAQILASDGWREFAICGCKFCATVSGNNQFSA